MIEVVDPPAGQASTRDPGPEKVEKAVQSPLWIRCG